LIHSKETGVGAKDLSGPVGILTMLAAQVHTDYRLALKFLVLLNINLALINLLPIPVLDGGHILMSIVEGIRRRPLSAKFQEYTTTAFAVLLISFMLYVTFFDIKRWPLFKSMFRRDTQIELQEKPNEIPSPALPPAK
jgi:regulator of sigma E protease